MFVFKNGFLLPLVKYLTEIKIYLELQAGILFPPFRCVNDRRKIYMYIRVAM